MSGRTQKVTKEEALRRMAEAAAPYAIRMVGTPHSMIPDLVLHRPAPDGREVARLRYFEPEGGRPFMRTVIPMEVSVAEQREVERHVTKRLSPVVTELFSFVLWISLAEGTGTTIE